MKFATGKTKGQKPTRAGRKGRKAPRMSLEEGIVGMAKRGELGAIGKREIERLKKKGIPVTFKRGQTIITQYADGREEILAEIAPVKFTPPPGVIIYKNQ